MRVLFISKESIAADLARRLQEEGHEVKLYINDIKAKECFENIVPKTAHWKDELEWVGKDGLIVFDDVRSGRIQSALRDRGYNVVGGSSEGEKIEIDREFGSEVFKQLGLTVLPLQTFHSIDDAIQFIKLYPNEWVVKHNDQSLKNYTYVGYLPDGSDVINVLETYRSIESLKTLTLQQKAHGIEIGVGRFFNGQDWVGPVEVNVEHTRFFPGDVGPITSEMGTVAWYEGHNFLFEETLAKLKPFLLRTDFRGDISLNCIVSKDRIVPLEATARFGTPIVHLQTELHESPWGEFLYAVASGEPYDLKWKRGFGVVTVIAAPPFPYRFMRRSYSSYNKPISFDSSLTNEDWKHLHFEEVGKRPYQDTYYVADSRGCVMHASAVAPTISEARQKTLSVIEKVRIPKMFYRNDIGKRFEEEDLKYLLEWGYVRGPFA